ncbi:NAD-dependent epimerase/dehydratase family protein [Chitinophaga agri]|uniref:NAD-dependent epimerase/dehydratase family protein n=1 Tax=Chitinophaga agri TaxID=2703787 RepID=A0A6B9Z8E9_9BACT|nr:NAD-dependent epimerase/dehydratase family protein [Chitinophaga agri]QHS58246.1 NAD-dependent epimerase/dehydratase family protein [Chitinophaga agri]
MKDNAHALITGASGFLGGMILDRLSDTYHFTTIGRKAVNAPVHLQMDLAREIRADIPVQQVVIHCAGKAHAVPRTAAEEKAFYEVNLDGTINLCRSLEASGAVPSSMVFISTVAVYGLDEGELVSEAHCLKGNTPYGKSKIAAEQFLTQWATEQHVQLLVLRLPLIAGINAPGNLGAMIKGIASSRYMSIGNATARKSIVWAGDVADLIPQVQGKEGVYNLTDGRHPSFRELETCIASALKKKQPVAIPVQLARLIGYAGDMLGRYAPVNSDKLRKITSTLTFDDTKAREQLGWNPSSVIEKLSTAL